MQIFKRLLSLGSSKKICHLFKKFVTWSIDRSFNISINQANKQSVVSSVVCSVVRPFGRLVSRSFGCSVVRSFSRSLVRSFGQSFVRSFGCSAVQSFAQSVNSQQAIENHSSFLPTVFSPSWLSVSLFHFLPRLHPLLLHLHFLRRYSPQNHPPSFSTQTRNRNTDVKIFEKICKKWKTTYTRLKAQQLRCQGHERFMCIGTL